MSLAYGRRIFPAAGHPEPCIDESGAGLSVAVVFTSIPATIQALKKAGALASQLSARITLLVPQIVPYPLPINHPPVLLDFNEKRFRVIARESPVETAVHIYLCRDRLDALSVVLKPHSLIVVGAGKTWRPTPEKRMAKQLRRAGHEVIVVET